MNLVSSGLRAFGLVSLVVLAAVDGARASVPTVVATSTAAYASSSGFGYVNKVIVDPYGNVYTTDSSNGAIWEVPFGSSTPIRINNFPLYASVSAGGTGYTSAPTVTFSAPAAGGVQATAIASINSGAVSALTITNHGSGYTSTPTITITGGGGTGATGSTSISLNATHGFTVDQYGDLIVSNSTSGNLYFFPYINGQLCTTCNAAGNEPLDLTSAFGFSTLDDYYTVVADVAADNTGNLFVAVSHCNNSGQACGASQDSIFLIPNINPSTTATTVAKAANGATLFQGALPGGKAVLNMTVDTSGHLYYVDGVSAYVVGTGSANLTPVTIGTGYKAPSGISLDQAGNLYVVDNSQKLLFEIPNEGGTLNAADQFTVASLTNPYYSVGFDHAGNIYQADGSDKVINKITIGALNFAATAVGGTPITANVNFRFNAAVTPAAIALVQGGGGSLEFARATASTCVAGTAYIAGQACLVAVTFTPSSTGTRQGAVVMQTSASKAIATAYLSGIGSGGALTVDPGTQVALTGSVAWKNPSAIALDAAGNAYVADSKANTVQVISAGGTAIASIGSGLSAPGGVAVDGAGNVFIADTGNSRIVEVPNEGGTLTTADQAVLGFSMLSLPSSVAVDAAGGIYVADTGNLRVVRLPIFAPSGTPLQTTIGSGYLRPVAVATDNVGNVYVADVTANQIDEINVVSTTQTILLPSLSAPTSLALDASGSLYVVNSSTATVSRYANSSTGLSTTPLSLGNNLVTPTGVAVNGAGNVAISDSGVPAAYLLQRSAGLINFGNVNYSLTSSPQSITLTSAGTAAVTLGATAYTAVGATADYAITSLSTGGCTNSEVLAVGATCGYSALLSPIVTGGTLTDVLTFSSNAVNASSISATLTGVATNLSLTTTILSQVTPSGNPVYGQAVTVSATVTTARAGVTPTGSVTFFVDGIKQKSAVTLSASSPYVASLTIPALGLTVGTHAINATYSGDANNASSAAMTALIVTVTKQPSAAAAVACAAAGPVCAGPSTIASTVSLSPGSSFVFSVSVAPTLGGTPTGTVNLVLSGTTTVLATATLGSSGTANIAYAPPAIVGQYQFQFVYLGDANFSGVTSNATTVSIQNPSYTVTIPTSSYTATNGQSIVIPVTVTWISGYQGSIGIGAVNLTTNVITPPCTGLPQYVTCVFSPGVATYPVPATSSSPIYPAINPAEIVNLTIAINQPPATPYPQPGFILWPGGLGLMLLSLLTGRKRGAAMPRIRLMAMTIAVFGILAALSGCTNVNEKTSYVTPKGTSTFTATFSGIPVVGAVSVTNPNITETLPVQLTVQ